MTLSEKLSTLDSNGAQFVHTHTTLTLIHIPGKLARKIKKVVCVLN